MTVNCQTYRDSNGLKISGGKILTPQTDQRLKRAQAMVAFCNGRTDDTRSLGTDAQKNINWQTVGYWARQRAALGFPKPFDVRYWEVGNEPYWTSISASHYAENFNEFCKAMKEVDPKIRIGAAGWNYLRNGDLHPAWGWAETVLGITKDYLDFYSIHSYYPSAPEWQAGDDPDDNNYKETKWFLAVMAGATQALSQDDLYYFRGVIDQYTDNPNAPPNQRRKVGLAVTEYGIDPYESAPDDEFPPTPTHLKAMDYANLARALFDADFLMQLVKNAASLRLITATSYTLHNNQPHAAIGPIFAFPNIWGTRSTRPQYYALKMVKDALATRRLVTTNVNSSQKRFSTDGEPPVGNVPASLTVDCLDALAALPNNNQTSLVLVVINRSLDNSSGDINTNIQVQGFTPRSGTATILGFKNTQGTLNNKEDHNEFGDRDDTYPNNLDLACQKVEPISENITPAPSVNFNYTFKAHSLTVLELRP